LLKVKPFSGPNLETRRRDMKKRTDKIYLGKNSREKRGDRISPLNDREKRGLERKEGLRKEPVLQGDP